MNSNIINGIDVREHVEMVHRIARKNAWMVKHAVSYEDLFQAGMEGLMKACERFDKDRGYLFYTYSRYWIQRDIRTEVMRCGKQFKLPTWLFGDKAAMDKALETRAISYSMEWKGMDPMDMIGGQQIAAGIESSVNAERQIEVKQELKVLRNENERALSFIKRHHVDGETMTEIGESEGISGEAVRQTIEKTKTRCRQRKAKNDMRISEL